eukprot:10658349-Karenia_brevis.AAC.1
MPRHRRQRKLEQRKLPRDPSDTLPPHGMFTHRADHETSVEKINTAKEDLKSTIFRLNQFLRAPGNAS